MLLMMSKNIARNMYSSQEIINYPTKLHLVGHFHIIYYSNLNYAKISKIKKFDFGSMYECLVMFGDNRY